MVAVGRRQLPRKQVQGNLAWVKYDSGNTQIDISILGVLTMMNIRDAPWLTFGELFEAFLVIFLKTST